MKQYCLKFADEQEAREILSSYILDGEWITGNSNYALDVIGSIYKPTGVLLTDSEGMEYPEMAAIEGFHVNLAVNKLPSTLENYIVVPETPNRVFAGIQLFQQ